VRARSARRESTESLPEHPSATDPPLGGYSREVLAALAELSPEHRAVVVMRYVLDYTPGEISRALELPRGTVNSRLRRGLDALESRLREADLR
jgi:RNA polymerase sigma-70 factor (ECF subfamily)